MSAFRRFVTVDQVETQVFPWGRLQWLSEPRVTGSGVMTTGVVTLEPGKGHDRHNHPGSEEILFVLEGHGVQTVETPEGTHTKEVFPGELIHLPEGAFHSTRNTGEEPMVLLAVYQFAGPEAALRADPVCTVEPPKSF